MNSTFSFVCPQNKEPSAGAKRGISCLSLLANGLYTLQSKVFHLSRCSPESSPIMTTGPLLSMTAIPHSNVKLFPQILTKACIFDTTLITHT
jgi:hypothetical protein